MPLQRKISSCYRVESYIYSKQFEVLLVLNDGLKVNQCSGVFKECCILQICKDNFVTPSIQERKGKGARKWNTPRAFLYNWGRRCTVQTLSLSLFLPKWRKYSHRIGNPQDASSSFTRLPDGKILSRPFLGLRKGGGRGVGGAIQGKEGEGITFCSVA